MSTRRFHFFASRLLPVLLALAGAHAMAQSDPPSRVGRLNHSEGPVVYSPAGDNEWTDASPNRPLTRGDRLWTDKRSRAEVQVGSSAVRLDGQTHLEILALDDQSAQLSVTQGSVYLRIRSLPEGENFEVDTPNLAWRAAYPGDYRIDVDPQNGTTRVTIHSGTGAAYGEGGQVQPLGGGQQVTFKARTLTQLASLESPPQDAFDRWAQDRNRKEDQAVSARYVPREVVGYQQLDAHGQWAQDATHGNVWFPQNMPANWAPYRVGHWEWIAPWGWTWIDQAAWGFAPFHYGRWAIVNSRWAWVPGRLALKPVYAPALVAFVGGGSNDWNLPLVSGKPAVAWFPLAPNEAWQPPYAASPVYLSNVNRNLTVQANASYQHQRSAEALTAIPAEDFHRGKPARAGWLQIAANTLTNAKVVPPPPMPVSSASPAAQVAKVAPPQQAQARQVVADAASARQAEAAQRQAQAAAQKASQAQAVANKQAQAQAQAAADAERVRIAAEQQREALAAKEAKQAARAAAKVETAKVAAAPTKTVAPPQANADEQAQQADQQRRAERARAAEQAKAEAAKPAEKARRAEQAKAAEQARAEHAKRAEEAKRERVAKREQAKRELAARRAEEARREQLAKQAEAAKREQVAREAAAAKREQLARREQAKREQLAKKEQARREALARREEQQRRDAQVELARRAAEKDAQQLAEQRARREAQEREVAQLREREKREEAQREAMARQQQALAEQWRRDRQAQEQQRVRTRPDLRDDKRPRSTTDPRGIPIISSGPMS